MISRSNHTAEQRRPKRDFGEHFSIMESSLNHRHCVGVSSSWPSFLTLRRCERSYDFRRVALHSGFLVK